MTTIYGLRAAGGRDGVFYNRAFKLAHDLDDRLANRDGLAPTISFHAEAATPRKGG